MRKPDCIFIGYQKSGTTFLRNYLTKHPDIHWTREGGFFFRSHLNDHGIEDYLGLFPEPAEMNTRWIDMQESLAVGLISENQEHWVRERLIPGTQINGRNLDPSPAQIANNIHAVLGKPRIIIMVRNQLTWLKSNYLHYYKYLPDNKKHFKDFLSTLIGKALLYSGMYDVTIKHYQNEFGRDSVHVIPLEKLHASQETTLAELCDFLEVSHYPFSPDPKARNAGRKTIPNKLVTRIESSSLYPLIRKIKKCVPFHMKITRVLTDREVIAPETIEFLQSCYSASNFNSSKLIGHDLTEFGYPT